MNSFRMLSPILVVATALSVGNTKAANSPNFNAASTFAFEKKFTGLSTLAARTVTGDFKKSGIETLGFLADSKANGLKAQKDPDQTVVAGHFVANYAIRKVSHQLNKNGVTAHSVSNKLDVLPVGLVRDWVHPVVETVVDTATEPEVLTLALLYAIANAFGGK